MRFIPVSLLCLALSACVSTPGEFRGSFTVPLGGNVSGAEADGTVWSVSVKGSDVVVRYGDRSVRIVEVALPKNGLHFYRGFGAPPDFRLIFAGGQRASWRGQVLNARGSQFDLDKPGRYTLQTDGKINWVMEGPEGP